MDETKQCKKCHKDLPLSEFGKNKHKKDGLQTWCKECNTSYQKQYYADDKPTQIQRVANYNQRSRLAVTEYKANKGCQFCGEKDFRCLDFHHLDRDEKDTEVSSLIGTIDKLNKEIAKCIVLCANCHRKLHYGEGLTDKQKSKNKDRRPIKPSILNFITKEEFGRLLWEIPSEEIAKRYNVSGSMVCKWARQLNLSKPPRGYWTIRNG